MDPYAWTISTDLQDSGQIPSFESLKAIDPCDDLSIKVVLLDKSRDTGLKELQNRLRSLSGGWITTKGVIDQLATFVCDRMGGAVFTEEHLGAHWEEYTELLKRCLGSVVLPIGSLSVGRCVHRALLFKDSCDPGNHSDVTEDRDDIKAQAPHLAETVASYAEEEKSEVRDACFPKELPKAQPNGVLQPSSVNMGGIQHQNNMNSFASESSTQEFAFPMAKEKQNEERQETYHYKYSHNLHNEPHSHGSPGNQSVHSTSSVAGSSFQKGNTSGSRNDHYALVPHQPSDRLSSVLDSLKQARVSLQNKFNRVPLIEGRSVAKPSVPAMNPGDRMDIPVGCAGLFRLPTDYSVEANMQGNFLDSGLSTTNYYRNKGVAITAGDRFVTSPYLETRSDISTSDPYFTSRTLSRYSSEKPRFDPFVDTVLSSSTRYTNSTQPSYPSYPTYPGTIPRMPPSEEFSRTFSSRTVGVPPADNIFYDGHGRSGMYM